MAKSIFALDSYCLSVIYRKMHAIQYNFISLIRGPLFSVHFTYTVSEGFFFLKIILMQTKNIAPVKCTVHFVVKQPYGKKFISYWCLKNKTIVG